MNELKNLAKNRGSKIRCFYRHPDNRAYAGKLKAQKGRHLKAGVFILCPEASQQKQQEQIRRTV